MNNFLKRNVPVFVIGTITILAFLGVIFRSQSRNVPTAELPQLKVVEEEISTTRDDEDLPIMNEVQTESTTQQRQITALPPHEVDARFGVVEIVFTEDGFDPIEPTLELNQKARWTNNTNREITLYQTTYNKFPEWSEDVKIGPGESFEFRFYKDKMWTYKERESQKFGSVFVKRAY